MTPVSVAKSVNISEPTAQKAIRNKTQRIANKSCPAKDLASMKSLREVTLLCSLIQTTDHAEIRALSVDATSYGSH